MEFYIWWSGWASETRVSGVREGSVSTSAREMVQEEGRASAKGLRLEDAWSGVSTGGNAESCYREGRGSWDWREL